MLFEGHELENFTAWPFHPFEGVNNINGINPDSWLECDEIAQDDLHLPASAGEDLEGLKTVHFGGAVYVGKGLSYNTLQDTPVGKRVLALQEAYLRQVIDTVHDLDNVLYEVCNEAGGMLTAMLRGSTVCRAFRSRASSGTSWQSGWFVDRACRCLS
jgi:hypothetical protein